MKVIIYQDYLRSGGTEWQSLFLAEQFGANGDDTLLLTNRPGGNLGPAVGEKGISWTTLQSKDQHLNWRCPGLLKIIKSFQPDVIVLMGRNANCQGFRIKKHFPHIRIVATFRTGRKVPSFYRKTLKYADMVACNSEYVAEKLSGLNLSPARMEIHPNACLRSGEILQSESHAGLDAFESFKPSHRLLYTAAFVRGKNHIGMLRVVCNLVKKYPDVLVYFLGTGPFISEIKGRSEKMGVARNLVFAGFQKDVASFYQHCDLAVSSSLEESMPNALVESQFAGLPVVAYDEAGVKECFNPGISGILVKRNDEQMLLSSICELMDNPDRRKEMSLAATAFARAKFDPEIRFKSFYSSVLKLAS